MVKTTCFFIGCCNSLHCKKWLATISPSSAGMSISPNSSWPGTGKLLTPFFYSVGYLSSEAWFGKCCLEALVHWILRYQGFHSSRGVYRRLQYKKIVRNQLQFLLGFIGIRAFTWHFMWPQGYRKLILCHSLARCVHESFKVGDAMRNYGPMKERRNDLSE